MNSHNHLLDRSQRSKVTQLVHGIGQAIRQGTLPAGYRLPSIRQLAAELGFSAFTISDAYDRLLQQGLLQSRPGAGYYVLRKSLPPLPQQPNRLAQLPLDSDWLLTGIYDGQARGILAGCGWLPESWYDADGIARAMRRIAREQLPGLSYGHPQGLPALRQLQADKLQAVGIPCSANQILLTQGATQALSILCDALRLEQQTVLVDSPGYCNLISSLKFRGCKIVGVPWTADGPELDSLARLLQEHRPRVFFTNPWQQNPTGASYSVQTAHGVLQLAREHDLLIVEDNVSADLLDNPLPTLAAMDGLQQVIHIGSYSKSLSPALRVGHLAAPPRWVEALTRAKMLAALGTSSHTEQLAYELVRDGKYRRHSQRLADRIAEHSAVAIARFEQLGWQVFQPASRSMFIWACPPPGVHIDASRAQQQQIYLTPGTLFHADAANCAYWRFNSAYLQPDAFWHWLRQQQ
ncbi:PLP-dependent aminotransferase family protein [Vogesella sp. LIG4]|uniref:aminotransferase-like domain-containing protein n=1 Tax=Vogesella sp. LIG4 TaxID=1192162 RepID=UPI0013905E7A|nr:PLP-dependent aminotransferase family protein [Vogesella sp. LIG4]